MSNKFSNNKADQLQLLRMEMEWLQVLLTAKDSTITKREKKELNDKLERDKNLFAELESSVDRDIDDNIEQDDSSANVKFLSPRSSYLAKKRAEKRLAIELAEANANRREKAGLPPRVRAVLMPIGNVYNVIKKGIDLLDDVWTATANGAAISKSVIGVVSPILIGVIGGIIQAVEAAQGLYSAIKATINPHTTNNRNTKMFAGFTIATLGSAGAGMSLAYMTTGFGAVIAGSSIMPMLIPAIMTMIFGVMLWKSYTQVKQYKARSAQIDYEIAQMEERKRQLTEANQKLVNHRTNNIVAQIKETTDVQSVRLFAELLSASHTNEFDNSCTISQLDTQIAELLQKRVHLNTKIVDEKRKTIFSLGEFGASLIVLTGVLLGTAAVVGAASVATFGALPLALIITGVVIGITLKIFESIDEKKGHRYSNWIANGLKTIKDNLFGPKLVNHHAEPRLAKQGRSSTAEIFEATGSSQQLEPETTPAPSSAAPGGDSLNKLASVTLFAKPENQNDLAEDTNPANKNQVSCLTQ